MGNKKNKLVLIGWDAADWSVIDELIDQGKMPALKRLLENGVRGKIATMDPPISPMLWTSIATGKEPIEHGILGFVEAIPDGSGIRPLYSTSRKVKAFWNILNQNDLKCNIVGWWPSHPAEPINGVMVSNFYQMSSSHPPKNWKLPQGTIYPTDLESILAEIRVHPLEITPNHVIPFLPEFYNIDHEVEKKPAQLRKEIAHAASVQSAFTYLLEHTDYDLCAAYFDFIDHCSHMGMRFREPQLPGITDEQLKFYKDLVNGAYIFQDMMLERVMELIDEDTSIMIVSDHGFESGKMRPLLIPNEPSGPTHEHSAYGIFVWSGPGIRKNERVYGSTLLDITPTILTYFGIPIAKDMKGNPIITAFESSPKIEYVESWETIHTGYEGLHSSELKLNEEESKDALNQLIELGYIEKPSSNIEEAIRKNALETDYYLARSLAHSQRFEEAIQLLEKIVEGNETVYRYTSLLANCYLKVKSYKSCKQLLSVLETNEETNVRAFAHLTYGKIALAQYKGFLALDSFKEAAKLTPDAPELNFQIANTLAGMKKHEEAIEYYDKVLLRNDRHVLALFGKAKSCLILNRLDESIDLLLEVVEYQFMFLPAHYYLGLVLIKQKEFQMAEQAFLTALHLSPKMIKPRVELIYLYTSYLPDKEKLKYHKEQLIQYNRIQIKGVIGLPDSGAEEVFDLLKPEFNKSEIRAFKSGQLAEFRVVEKDLSTYSDECIYLFDFQNLMNIDHGQIMSLVFINRHEEELLHQQLLKGNRQDVIDRKIYPTRLAEANRNQLELFEQWLIDRPEVEVLQISYQEFQKDPHALKNQILNYYDSIAEKLS